MSFALPSIRSDRARRPAAIFAVLVLAFVGLVAVPTLPAQADVVGDLPVSVEGPTPILAAESGSFTVEVTNGGGPRYNLGFAVLVPAGLEPGAVTTLREKPVGAPRVITAGELGAGEPPTGYELWVWEDLSDLPAGATTGLVVPFTPASGAFPVGSEIEVVAEAHTSSDAVHNPVFPGSTGLGGQDAVDATESSSPETTTIDVTAVRLTKTETVYDENEVLRGVHDQRAIYHLRIENTETGDTRRGGDVEDVVVVDWLPAGLEFLGDGDTDHSTHDWSGEGAADPQEYAGSGTMARGAITGYVEPFTVETLAATAADAARYGVVEGDVYTKVTWIFPDGIDAGDEIDIFYAAGVPLRANTLDWSHADDGEPAADTLEQGANLDNNTGASTRQGNPADGGAPDEGDDGDAWTNSSRVDGHFQGPVADGADRHVWDADEETITAMDLAIVKSVNRSDFVHGQIAEFTLTVRTSEYATSAGITVTDTIPDGMCLADSFATPADCLTGTGAVFDGWQVTALDAAGVGEQEVTFAQVTDGLPVNATVAFTYPVLMGTEYGTAGYGPTTTGDSFTNTVEIAGTSTPIDPTPETGPWSVWDDSSAGVVAATSTISKKVLERDQVTALCDAATDPGSPAWVDEADGFRLGDTVCYLLTVNFPGGVDTRNPVVSDVLPAGLENVTWEQVPTTPAVTVGPLTQVGQTLTWEIGAPVAGTDDRIVAIGSTLHLLVRGTVGIGAVGAEVDKPANLMKYREENVDGDVFFARDEASAEIVPAPLSLLKGVQDVDGDSTREADTGSADGSVFGSNRDGIEVVEGETIRYRIDLTSDYPVHDAVVWDLLPAVLDDLDEAAVQGLLTVPTGVTLQRASALGITSAPAARWVLEWTGVDVDTPAGDDYIATLSYTLDVSPEMAEVGSTHTNTAAVISYRADTNDGGEQDYFPADGPDYTGRPDVEDRVPAQEGRPTTDPSHVTVENVTVTKGVRSPEGTNNGGSAMPGATTQVTIGEWATYTYAVRVPANTMVIDGRLSDALPGPASSWEIDATQTSATLDGGALPTGFTLTAATGQLDFPATYLAGNDDETFQVSITARIRPGATWTHAPTTNRNNTARFFSGSDEKASATAGTRVIEPNPQITKSADAEDGTILAEDEVTYTLTASNQNGRPTSFDTVVVDCVPAGLEVLSTDPAVGVTVDTAGADCTGTLITWSVGDLAAQGATGLLAGEVASPQTLTYVVRIDPLAGAGVQYDNTAEITGYSVPEEPGNTDPYRRAYVRTDDESITAVRPRIDKTVDGAASADAVVGEIVDYQVVVTVPAMINLYDTVITDVVPAGIAISDVGVSYGSTWAPAPGATPSVSGQTITLDLGDVARSTEERTVTITYRGTVRDVSGSSAGTELENTATLAWNVSDDDPTTRTSTEDDATVTVREPVLTIVKKVDHPATDPAAQDAISVDAGGDFHYRVVVTNTGTATAHDVEVVDTVPTGVVVDEGSIMPAGGDLSGADPTTGGGTITWTLESLAVGANQVFTYDGSLTSSTTLDGSALENVAKVTEYFSHPGDPTGEDFDDAERRRHEGPQDDASVTPLFPDPTITKTVDPATTALGEAIAFEIVVTNDGDSPLATWQVTDQLPAGWTVSDATPAPTSQSGNVATGLTLVWEGGPLAVGASTTIVYDATPAPDHPWTDETLGLDFAHTNTARVTGKDGSGATEHLDPDTDDPVLYADEDAADANIPLVDLALTKVVVTDEDDVVAGQPLTWGLDVRNLGPDAEAGPVTIVDEIPAGVVADSLADLTVAGPGWTAVSYDADERELTLRYAGGIAAPSGGVAATLPRVTVTAVVDPGFVPVDEATRTLTNSATVSGTTDELVKGNNDDEVTVSVRASADLELVKLAETDSYVPGTPVTWEIDVTNHGPSVSRTPFTVVDELPAEVDPSTLEILSGADWSIASVDGSTVTFAYAGADLDVDAATSTLRYRVTVRSDVLTTDPIVNDATVFPTTPDDNPDNDDDDAPVNHGTALADLSIAKSLDSEALVAGEGGRYRLEVTNDGPSYAVDVVVTDTLPAGISYAGELVSDPDGDHEWVLDSETENPDGTTTLAFSLVTNSGMLPDGHVTWFTFDVAVDSALTADVTNVAEVTSSTPDDVPDNNDDTETSTPVVETNLSITKEHEQQVRRVGDDVVFTVTVTNHGPADAADVQVTDALPAGLTFEDVSDVLLATDGRTWTHTVVDDELTATLDGTLPAGETAVVEITATLTPASFPAVTNTVTVETSTDETTTDDNVSDDEVPVDSPDLRVVKTAEAESVQGGDELTYTIVVTNHGGAHADEVTLTDTLPAELEYVTSVWDDADLEQATGEVCEVTGADEDGLGGTLDCLLPDGLAAGQSATLVVTLAVPADIAVDSVTNTVTVASDDEDPSLREDNDDEETTPVRWIQVAAQAVCVLEAPWLDYTVDLHNVAAGEPLVLEWYADADGDGIPDGRPIHSETVGTAAGDLISGRVLWPGAEVDEDGIATALPGYRPAKHGETATWQHMVEDESLPEHALRGDVILRFTINPESSAAVSYVGITPDCLAERDTVLEITKTADAERVDAGDTLTYTIEVRNTGNGAARDVVVTDQIPAELKVEKVTTAKPESRQLMPWQECTVRGQDERGYGGTVTCELGGVLARGQAAPPITIVTTVDPEAESGDVVNVAQVEWTSADGDEEDGVAEDDAEVEVRGDEDLAVTGAEILRLLGIAAVLVLGGALLVLVVRTRRA